MRSRTSSRWPARRSCTPSCTEGPGTPAGPFTSLRGRGRGHRPDLDEQRHEVEVMLCLGDLVALEGHDLDRGSRHMLVAGRDRTHGTRELAAVRSLPHDLEHDGVVAFDGLLDRALDVGKGLPPALAEL